MSRPEDFRDDFEPPSRHGENPTSAGLLGLVCAGVTVALLVVVGILWYLLKQEAQQAQNPDAQRWMMLWFLFLDGLSLGTAVAALGLGIRGLAPTNPLYRGYSVVAIVLGSIEIIATLFFGCFIFCCGLLFAGV